jgi:hypothetical protein
MVEPHPFGLFQPIQQPPQADAVHVAVLIRSRDLSPSGTLMWISESSDPYNVCGHKHLPTAFLVLSLAAIDINYRNICATHNRRVISS